MTPISPEELLPFSPLTRENPDIPLLATGQRLTEDQFLRRWDNLPYLTKAELIDGVVYIDDAPVSARDHGTPHGRCLGWLGQYEAETPTVDFGGNSTLRFDGKNLPQADAYLFIREEFGGQSRIDEQGYISGSPELLAEITASTSRHDLKRKRKLYGKFGVLEYLIWQVPQAKILWLVLQDGEYAEMPLDDDGILRSRNFPGLWLDVEGLLGGRQKQVFATLNAAFAQPEHALFAARTRKI